MIKDRVIQLVESKGVVKETFFEKIGMSSANFRGNAKKTPLNSTAIENILSTFPDVNPDWLLTGEGEMLRPSILESVSAVANTFGKAASAFSDAVAPAVSALVSSEEKIPMTNDERIDALIQQNNILSEANITLAKASQDAVKASQDAIKASQDAIKTSQDAIKMAHDTIAANQRQGETNQEIMKQLLFILENSKKNLRAVGVPGAVATRTAHG